MGSHSYKINEVLEKIYNNERFLRDRRNEHAFIVGRVSGSVKSITIIKAILIIFISILQIYFVTKIFSGRGKHQISCNINSYSQENNYTDFNSKSNIYL